MHPAVAASLLSANAPPGGVAYPYGAPPAQPQSQSQPNPSSTKNNGDTISYSLPAPPPYSAKQPIQPPPPYSSGPPPSYSYAVASPPPYSAKSLTEPPPPYGYELSPPPYSLSPQSAPNMTKIVQITDAKVYDRERIRKALRNVIIFAATLSGSMLIIAPILLELRETRAKAKLRLHHEDFKLALRNALRGADDLSLKWVRRWEVMHVDPLLTQHIASYMLGDWDAFTAADNALKSAPIGADKKTALENRENALKKIEEWEIPLVYSTRREDPYSRVDPSKKGLDARFSVGPKAGERITVIYHDTLRVLQEAAKRRDTFLDGDTFRLIQFNAEKYLGASLSKDYYAKLIESLRLYPTRDNARQAEYHTKLASLHQTAVRKFIEMPR